MKPHPVLLNKNKDGTPWVDLLNFWNNGVAIYINDKGQHLLQGPRVVTKLLPEALTQPEIYPRIGILHSNAGSKTSVWTNLWNWLSRNDVYGEPHFQVDLDGTIAQMIPLTVRADCNYKANRFWLPGHPDPYGAISFETQDLGSASLNTTPWNKEQLDRIIETLVAICICYNVACSVPPTWNSSGIGHHTLFPNEWTNVKGKTCPGAARIRQMDFIRNSVAERLVVFGNSAGWACKGLGG